MHNKFGKGKLKIKKLPKEIVQNLFFLQKLQDTQFNLQYTTITINK